MTTATVGSRCQPYKERLRNNCDTNYVNYPIPPSHGAVGGLEQLNVPNLDHDRLQTVVKHILRPIRRTNMGEYFLIIPLFQSV